ncbi:MAG: antibiotic biosynthesis monooxygenase [Dehalococcoidia bacterium]|nr:antibiotic biosynthesis monooxygenase [Dehalococcoidia bacterium]
MAYIRLSIAKARRGEEARLLEVMRRLCAISTESEGCLATYLLESSDGSGDIARISVYKDEASAEHVAQQSNVLALRSEQHLLCEPGHTERAFVTVD